MLDNKKPHIIDVTRKPSKCPDCGSPVVDIIYGTGNMTEIEFVLEYRKDGIMGGDNIPRRPPIWSCSCGCKRFRKVNPDGTDATVKVKMLKNMRKAPAAKINWTSDLASRALEDDRREIMHHYAVVTVAPMVAVKVFPSRVEVLLRHQTEVMSLQSKPTKLSLSVVVCL